MATANTNDLRLHNTRNFIESLHGPNETYRGYVFLGRSTPWELDNETQEEVPPVPTSSVEEFYRTYQEMTSLKAIETDDVYYMIRRNLWISGTIYDIYRHDYTPSNVSYSGAKNLWDSQFYVINQNNVVYVCLDNNGDRESTVEPQNDTSDPFYTSDGYLWLKLYTISVEDQYNHSTERYIPITTESVSSTTPGAVYTVKIEVAGSGFTSNPTGLANQVPFYYCKILGDGQGAVARVAVSNQKVTEIVVVRAGSGYTYGVLDFTPFNVYTNLNNLDQGTSALDPLGDGTFRSKVIITPPGGWGYTPDPLLSDNENSNLARFTLARQLGSTRVGVFSTLNYVKSDFVNDASFRQIGILQDPKFTDLVEDNPDTATSCYAVKIVDDTPGTSYQVGETIRQVVEVLETGEPDKYAIGQVIGWDSVTQVLRYIQVPQKHSDTDGVLYRFRGEAEIAGLSSGKIEKPDFTFNSISSDVQFADGYANSEVVPYSGLITYVVNISPIKRQPTQSEKITLIISY
jgi:hypothetical protein